MDTPIDTPSPPESAEEYTIRSRLRHAWINITLIRNWPRFLLTHVGLIREAVSEYFLRSGPRLFLRNRTSDFVVLREVFHYGFYDHEKTPIAPCATIVDIGAHVGMFATMAAARAPGARIVAMEPFPGNYQLLVQNLALNSCKNVIPMNQAVGSATGRSTFNISKTNPAANSMQDIGPHSFKIDVDVFSLEDLMVGSGLSRIDLLKIDCEGGEKGILASCHEETFSKIRSIMMEIHPECDSPAEPMMQFLRTHGYSVECRGRHLYAWRS